MTREEIARDLDVRRSSAALWFSALAGPVSFLIALQVKYTAVSFVCRNGLHWVMWVAPLLLLAVTVGAGLTAWRHWGSEHDRIRFMAIVGVELSTMFTLAIIALCIPDFFFSVCD